MVADKVIARKAAYILGRLGDLAIGPLLDLKAPYSPLQQAWRIKRLVKAQIQRRNEIVAELKGLLTDKATVPYPVESGPIEETPAEERICDIAYILLRELLLAHQDEEEQYLNTRFFRDLEFEDRDIKIEKYLSNGILDDFSNETKESDNEEQL